MEQIDSGVDLRALRALVEIADSGSFTAAANRLGYSQSAISHRVAALERSLQAPLFSRPGGRGAVCLPRAGQVAHSHALAPVKALEAGVGREPPKTPAALLVGVFQSAAADLLPPALRVLRRDW